MRSESVAKRTRLSALQYRNKRIKRTRDLQQKTRELHDRMLSGCKVISVLMEHLNEKVLKLRQQAKTQKSKTQLFQLETKKVEVSHKLKRLQQQCYDAQQIMDNIFVDKLHPHDCKESAECILKMQRKLKEDPLSLERKQSVYADLSLSRNAVTERCPPLHAAVMSAHVKCVKFLLEIGADVTSLTSTGESVLDSMYDPTHGCFDDDPERPVILKLLLQYGVSNMFCETPFAGELALVMSTGKSAEEVSLLLLHGATMQPGVSQNVISEEWELFNLPVIKLLFLHHRNRLNFDPDFHVNLERIIKSCYWRMVLAGVPSNECHEKVLEALHFYKIFGGKFPESESATNDSYQDLMQFLKSYKHRRHLNAIKSEIKALVSNPLSLQEISRLAVRKYIHRNYVENIKELPLPEALQSFLRFDDVTITELPEEYHKFGDDEYSSSEGEGSSDIE